MALRQLFPFEEIDYVTLMSALSNYANPRDKIRNLLASNELIRVKKDLYIFCDAHRKMLFSKEVLANLIYGPSYISLEYALSFYQLIPERVETLTCVTNKHDKIFHTPIGSFSYRYLHPKKYPTQINLLNIDSQRHILIASPGKAIADLLMLTKNLKLNSLEDMESYIVENMRFDVDALKNLKRAKLL